LLSVYIPKCVLFPEFLVYKNIYRNDPILYYNKLTLIKNYMEGGYSKSKWKWYRRGADIFKRYYFELFNSRELGGYLRFKSLFKFVFFSLYFFVLKFFKLKSHGI
jgi:hypothetical protein